MKALSSLQNKEVKDRIVDKIFNPLLENNKTLPEPSSGEEEEEMAKQEHYHRHVDGGKIHPRTVKEIKTMIN